MLGRPLRIAIGTASAAALIIPILSSSGSAAGQGLTLGAGVGGAPDYEGSDEYQAIPLLVARVGFGDQSIELRGTAVHATLLTNGTLSAGPVVNYRFGRDDVDEDAVDALDDVDDAVELGGFIGFFSNGLLGNLTALQDVTDTHDGYLIEAQFGYRVQVSPSHAQTIILTGTYADNNYMDTYFSINAGDAAASGLDEFDADEGFKDVGVTLNLQLGGRQGLGLTGILSYKRLLDDAEDSPVVDDVGDEDQIFGGVALTYSF